MHYVFNPDHYIGIVIANTTLSYKYILFPIIVMCYIHYVQRFYCYSAFHMFSMFSYLALHVLWLSSASHYTEINKVVKVIYITPSA